METFVTVVHVITCILIIIVVLMQSGKGADISASLGGSSNTVFGSSGGANFFTKTTFTLAAIFMITSLGLTILGTHQRRSVFDDVAPTSLPQEASAPASEGASAGSAPQSQQPAAPASQK